MTILVITYHSGVIEWIPKDKDALDFILMNLNWIEDVVEVDRASLRKRQIEPVTPFQKS